jgi:hypothetical protein
MTDHQGLPSMNQPLRGHSWDAKKHHDNASNEVIGTKGVNIVRTGRNVGQSFRFVYRGPKPIHTRSIRGLFISIVFACCTVRNRSSIVTNSTHFLIQYMCNMILKKPTPTPVPTDIRTLNRKLLYNGSDRLFICALAIW